MLSTSYVLYKMPVSISIYTIVSRNSMCVYVYVCVFMYQPKIEVVQGLEHYDGFRDYSYGIMIKMQLFEE